jgi:hypothetical protein
MASWLFAKANQQSIAKVYPQVGWCFLSWLSVAAIPRQHSTLRRRAPLVCRKRRSARVCVGWNPPPHDACHVTPVVNQLSG